MSSEKTIQLKRIADSLATICNVIAPVAIVDASKMSAEDMEKLREMSRTPRPVAADEPAVLLGTSILMRDAGPGLYVHEGTLIVKTEYFTAISGSKRYRADCYIVETGEYFTAGGPDVDMSLLPLTPVSIKLP